MKSKRKPSRINHRALEAPAHAHAASAHAHAASAHAHAASAHAASVSAHATDSLRNAVYSIVSTLANETVSYSDEQNTQLGDLISDDQGYQTLAAYLTDLIQHYQPDNSLERSELSDTTTMSDLVSLVRSKT